MVGFVLHIVFHRLECHSSFEFGESSGSDLQDHRLDFLRSILFWGTGVTRFGFICEALGRRLFLDSGEHSESKGSQLGSFLKWGTPKLIQVIDYQWENHWEKG